MVFRDSSSSARAARRLSAWRRLRPGVGLPLLAAASLLPAAAHGLGLGRLTGEAILGDPLQLTIPLTGSLTGPLDPECIVLRRPPDAVDAEYFPRDLRSRIERRDGASVLVLTSAAALRQPLVEFRVTISCGYNLSHDYLLMASPRPAARTSAAGAVPAEPPRTVTAAPAAVPAPAQSGDGQGMPDGIPAKVFLVERSLTLEELARLHFPGPLRRERFARWVVEANPQFFAGVRDVLRHRFEPGQQVLVPAGVPPRRPGDHQARSAAPAPGGADEAPVRPGGRPAKAAAEGKSKVPDDGRQGRLVIGSAGGTARDVQETLALVDRLAGMLELQVVAQNANDERIRGLETAIAELTRSLAQIEAGTRQDEARRQAELLSMRRTLAERSNQNWLYLLVAILAGGLAGAGLLQALRRYRGRGPLAPAIEATVAPVPSPVTTAAAPAEPRPAMPAAEPPKVMPPVAPAQPGAGRAMPAPVRQPAPAPRIDFEPPAPKPAATARPIVDLQPDAADPAAQAIELADVMVSMGLANSAANTLVKHIQENPRQSLFQWVKLLELHRASGNREQFEASAREMSQHFNVQPATWTGEEASGRQSLEAYPHLRARLLELWGTPECTDFLQSLLIDNRDGTRVGFPLVVVEEILLMMAVHDVRP